MTPKTKALLGYVKSDLIFKALVKADGYAYMSFVLKYVV